MGGPGDFCATAQQRQDLVADGVVDGFAFSQHRERPSGDSAAVGVGSGLLIYG